MWIWEQAAGRLTRLGNLVGTGYSGAGKGKNNPALERVNGVGPIPHGQYLIGWAYDDRRKGPMVMSLQPRPGQEIFGRRGFLIHGDSAARPGTASKGCIILGPTLRGLIAASEDRILEVVSG